jgi:uncharacterized metal-binding protein YceD (DUF177 family)
MSVMKEFLIPFVGLKVGEHNFEYQINNTFFQEFDYDQFDDIDVKAEVILNKKQSMLEFTFKHSGVVNLPCDLTGELFDLPIKGEMLMIVTFGEVYNDDNEELLVLPHGEYQINIAQYIYESIVLSIPVKRINPAVEQEDISVYENHIILEEPDQSEEEIEIDPRWEKLKELLKDK